MTNALRRAAWMCRHLGPGWLLYRAGHGLAARLGLLRRRTPPGAWADRPLANYLVDPGLAEPHHYLNYRRRSSPAFFFRFADRGRYAALFEPWDAVGEGPDAAAAALANGVLRYFEHVWVNTGFPPDWHRNPFTGRRTPTDRHWSEVGDFDGGDIKVTWEPSRFGFAYALVRAYWRSGDEEMAELFWRLVESWGDANPPNLGANWKCGQEVSFRVMAWCFGLHGFLECAATTPARVALLAQMIAASGARIEANLGYALSQRNNHGISEGLGLFTVGTLFPEFRNAARWRVGGRHVLERLGRELIYDDGAFAQHSANYHRLMLHDYLWAIRLGEVCADPLSDELKGRVGRAGELLYQLQDEATGRVPCFGWNDGALILPLSSGDYRDYRPVIQATHFLTQGTHCYGPGPWDEDLLWLFGPEALTTHVGVGAERALPLAPASGQSALCPYNSRPTGRRLEARATMQAPDGGYHTLRSSGGFAFVRCSRYRHRPAHADQLHVDLWWRGQNIALDPGSYGYSALPPWDRNPLARTAYHNTVTVDDRDQMEQVSPFLWVPWARGKWCEAQTSPEGPFAWWEGEHDGYRRLDPPVGHRRLVLRLGEERWVVADVLESTGEHRYRLHWLLLDVLHEWQEATGHLALLTPQGPYHVQLATSAASAAWSLVRADEDSPRGWQAPYYADREPALSLDLVVSAGRATFWTVFGPEVSELRVSPSALDIAIPETCVAVRLGEGAEGGPLLDSVSPGGEVLAGACGTSP